MATIAVIIARFQTPYLHSGHKQLIEEAQEKHTRTVIVLGISPVPATRKNPFDYCTREKMIKAMYPDVMVLPLSDHPSDTEWSANLDQLLNSVFPSGRFCLYGSRDSFIPLYSGHFPTAELPAHGDHSATTLRLQYADKPLSSTDFRTGILYACYSQYNKVYPTVDIVLFRNQKTELLLGRKNNSTQWRLPGGFADPADESYNHAALRELKEECGNVVVGELQYELSARIDDWRYRTEADKIITTLFSCDLVSGEVTANDDLEELRWFPLSSIPGLMASAATTGEHHELLQAIIHKYLKN